jgi:hypothetical protein
MKHTESGQVKSPIRQETLEFEGLVTTGNSSIFAMAFKAAS